MSPGIPASLSSIPDGLYARRIISGEPAGAPRYGCCPSCRYRRRPPCNTRRRGFRTCSLRETLLVSRIPREMVALSRNILNGPEVAARPTFFHPAHRLVAFLRRGATRELDFLGRKAIGGQGDRAGLLTGCGQTGKADGRIARRPEKNGNRIAHLHGA